MKELGKIKRATKTEMVNGVLVTINYWTKDE